MDLISRKWCDIIFEGRNKDYGAYNIRIQSGWRCLVSIGVVMSIVAVSVIFFFINDLFTYTPSIKVRHTEDVSLFKPSENKHRVLQKHTGQHLGEAAKKTSIVSSELVIKEDKDVQTPTTTTSDTGASSGVGVANYADSTAIDTAATLKNAFNANNDIKDFKIIEQLPEYPGGMTAFMKWLTANLKYPLANGQQQADGRVVASFLINKNGTVSDIVILKSFKSDFDKEVLRVLRLMPKWKPGTENGKHVSTQFVIPINFKSK